MIRLHLQALPPHERMQRFEANAAQNRDACLLMVPGAIMLTAAACLPDHRIGGALMHVSPVAVLAVVLILACAGGVIYAVLKSRAVLFAWLDGTFGNADVSTLEGGKK